MKLQLSVIGIIVSLITLTGCHPYVSKGKLSSTPRLLNSRTLMQRQSQIALREAMENLSDSSHKGLQARGIVALTGFGLQEVADQTCQDQPDGAIITIKSSQSSSMKSETATKSFSKDVFINSEVIRSYVLADEDLECDKKAPIIEVDLDKDLLNLQLEVKNIRQEKTFLAELLKHVEPKSATTAPETPGSTDIPVVSSTDTLNTPDPDRLMTSITATTEGTRKVTFTAENGEVKDLVSYSKESTGTANRKESLQTSDGLDQELNFAIQSSFKMIDTYNEDEDDFAVGKGPVLKEISSGSVKSTLKDQGYVETTFTGVTLEFSNGLCAATAGKIQSKFFAEGETVPTKTIDFDVALDTVSVSTTVSNDDVFGANGDQDILSANDLKKELCTLGDFLD